VGCVARCERSKIEDLLILSPELMVKKTKFIDCESRTFPDISAFELALWAPDRFDLIDLMIKCLPNDTKGLQIAQRLKEQYNDHKKQGVTYVLGSLICTMGQKTYA
jgi:hypothetical protein